MAIRGGQRQPAQQLPQAGGQAHRSPHQLPDHRHQHRPAYQLHQIAPHPLPVVRHTVDRLFEHCIRHHPNGDQQRIKDASSHQPGLRASPAAQEEYRQEGEEQKDGVVVPHPGGQPQGEPKQQIQRPPARPAPARPQHPLHCRAHGCASQQERPPLQQLLPYRQNDHFHFLPTPAPRVSRQAAPPAGRSG